MSKSAGAKAQVTNPRSKEATSKRKPVTEADIRKRAHEIYLEREGAPGSATEDWLKAEAELNKR